MHQMKWSLVLTQKREDAVLLSGGSIPEEVLPVPRKRETRVADVA